MKAQYNLCSHCGGIIPWPGIALPQGLRDTLNVILERDRRGSPIKNMTLLAKELGASYQATRYRVVRLRSLLDEVGLDIHIHPLRIVGISREGTQST